MGLSNSFGRSLVVSSMRAKRLCSYIYRLRLRNDATVID